MKRLILLLALAALPLCAQGRTPTAAVMPLQARSIDSNSVRVLEDALTDGLIRSGKLRMMERSQMAVVLKEQGFQKSGACDGNECAVQIGKLLGIERSVIGSVGLLGKTYVINARLIDIATGEVVTSSQRSVAGEIDKALTDLIPATVADLTGTSAPAKAAAGDKPAADKKSSHAWAWWTVGGLALAGGAAAAVILVSGKKSTANETVPGNPTTPGSTTDVGSLNFTWIGN